MGGWVQHVAEQWLSLIYESIKSDVRSSLYLNADETPITCLDSDFCKGSRKGYLWVYTNRQGDCVYEWHMEALGKVRRVNAQWLSRSLASGCLQRLQFDQCQGRLPHCWVHGACAA